MKGTVGQKTAVVGLLVLLLAALIAVAILYPRATRSLVGPHQQALVAKAQRQAAHEFGTTAIEMARRSFPIALELSEMTCVELRPLRQNIGTYLACYDKRTGEIVEERVGGTGF